MTLISEKAQSKHRGKRLILLFLELCPYSILWYLNLTMISACAAILISMSTFSAASSQIAGRFIDFTKNYACSQIAKTNPKMIWDDNTQASMLNTILHSKPTDITSMERKLFVAPYTPQSLLLLMPLTNLPLNQAIIIFEIFSISFAIIVITALLKMYQQYSIPKILLWWFIVLSSLIFLQNICLGQMTPIIAGLAGLIFLSLKGNKVILPAASLALLCAIKPQRGLILIIMLIATKRFKILTAMLLFSILLLSICASVIGIDQLWDYPEKLQNIIQSYQTIKLHGPIEFSTTYTLGLPSLLSFLAQKSIGHNLVPWSTILDLLLCYFVWNKASKAGSGAYPFALIITLIVDLILGPYANLYDIFMLNIGWAMTLPEVELFQFSKLQGTSMQLWFLSFLFFPIIDWLIQGYCYKFGGSLHVILLSALLLIAIWNFKNIISQSKQTSIAELC